jgi:hypothetical protein
LSVDSDEEENYVAKEEKRMPEAQASRDDEEYDRDSPNIARCKEEHIGGKEPR